MICSLLIAKQYFPRHRLRNKWSSLRSNLPLKSSTVPSAPKFGPPQLKIPGSAPDMTPPYLLFSSFDASTLLKGVP